MRRHRGVIAVLLAVGLGVIGVGSALVVVSGGSSGGGSAPPASAATGGGQAPASASTTVAPDPADIAAARTCQAWDNYLSAGLTGTVPPAVGQSLLSAAEALLAGAQQDQAAGRPLPKWVVLGGDVLAGAQDVVNGNTEALQSDGAAVAAQCKTIPAAAAVAGGFVAS